MKTAGVITILLLMMFAMTSVAARCKKFRRQIKSLTKEKENLVKEVEILQSQLKESESGRCDVNAQCICKAGFSGDGKTCTKLIDGGYSKWSSWSQCSTTCGDGLRSRSRSCTNPPPNAEGKDCAELGPDKETEECNNGNCPGCPAGWVTNGVSCYYLDPTRTKKMSDARQKCQSLGAHLPIIRSANERDFIFDMLKKHQSLTNEGVWLGLERRAGSSFYWVDGTPLNYQTWGSGEPNNYGGNENCAQMYKGGGNAGKWNDNPCDYGAAPGVLCQKPI